MCTRCNKHSATVHMDGKRFCEFCFTPEEESKLLEIQHKASFDLIAKRMKEAGIEGTVDDFIEKYKKERALAGDDDTDDDTEEDED